MSEKILSRKEIKFGVEQDEKFKVPVGRILEDKIAIITGCSSGLGGATTRAFLEAGAKVFGCYFSRADSRLYPNAIKDIYGFVHQYCYHHEFSGLDLDIAHESSAEIIVENAIKKFGKIDILGNFAGFAYVKNHRSERLWHN